MLRKKSLPRQLSGFSCLAGLSFVLIALLLIACDKNPTEPEKHANVVLEGEIIVRQGIFDSVEYLGKVKNIGDADARLTTIIFDTYNKDNELISVDSGFIGLIAISPGRVASFDVWTDVNWIDYDHYEYQIDWQK